LFFVACSPKINDPQIITEIDRAQENEEFIKETCSDYCFYNEIFLGADNLEMQLYTIGNYYIVKLKCSASLKKIVANFYHYLVFDKYSDRYLVFKSLSQNMDNFQMRDGTLYVDVLSNSFYMFNDRGYFSNDSSIFEILHYKVSNDVFSEDNICIEEVFLGWNDIQDYSIKKHGLQGNSFLSLKKPLVFQNYTIPYWPKDSYFVLPDMTITKKGVRNIDLSILCDHENTSRFLDFLG